jgi:hypothetical protein
VGAFFVAKIMTLIDLSLIIIAGLSIFIVYLEISSHIERRSHTQQVQTLLDRLMARSLGDYKAEVVQEENDFGAVNENIVDLSEMKNELTGEDGE